MPINPCIVLDPNIPNQEELVLRYLVKVMKNPLKLGEECAELIYKHFEALKTVNTIDDLYEVSPMVCEFLMAAVEAAHTKKVEEKKAKFIVKGLNRAEYTHSAILEHVETKSKEDAFGASDVIRRWKGTIKLECAGLLPRMEEHLYGVMDQPCAISIQNSLPPSEDLGLPRDVISPEHWDHMFSMGLVVVGERVGFQTNNPGWSILTNALPDPISARSYALGIKAPLVQGGYLPEVKVSFGNLVAFKPSEAQNLSEMLQEVNGASIYEQVPMGDDGSGRYHPDAPEMQELIQRYGLVPMQIRVLDARYGIFAKGIIVPDEQALNSKGEPCILLSWKQIKGKLKAKAVEYSKLGLKKEYSVHLGVLRTWDRKRQMVGCFELLENIAAVPREGESDKERFARAKEMRECINSLVDQAMADLGKDGIEGLLASIAKDDKMMSLVVKLLAKGKSKGIHMDPMSIDRVKRALNSKLRNRLWTIAQGAGMSGRQLVIVNDGSLAPGECVTTHYKVGTELATWRFPIVLSQSLLTLKVIEPRPHHLIGGKVVEQCIYMNLGDVLAMQGDDDGDIVAVTPDPRVRFLFQNILDPRRYAIEPQGEKLSMDLLSPEGLEYMRSTPMGPVGLMTINRAKLLAVGDVMGALAMSVLVQECIDKAKRKVRWTCWEKAAVLDNWKLVDGIYHIHFEGDDNYRDMDPNEELPVKDILGWVNERLTSFGCNTKEKEYPLGWRKNRGEEELWDGAIAVSDLDKQIDPSFWESSSNNQNGYKGGNLVHEVYDRAFVRWQEIASEFQGTAEKGDVGGLLLELLKQEGAVLSKPTMEWTEYMKVRQLAGISEFSENMQAAMKMEHDQESGSDKDRYSAIDNAYMVLQSRLKEYVDGNPELGMEPAGHQGLVDIWCMETTTTFRVNASSGEAAWYTHDLAEIPKGAKYVRVNNPNHAINAICWPGSPIMALLGITSEDHCTFLTPKRLKNVVDQVMEAPNVFTKLASFIWAQTTKPAAHELATGIPGHACQHCKDLLQTEVVRKLRSAKRRTEKAFLGKLIAELNGDGRTERQPGTFKKVGVNVQALLVMENEELWALKEDLSGDTSLQGKATIKAINMILKGLPVG